MFLYVEKPKVGLAAAMKLPSERSAPSTVDAWWDEARGTHRALASMPRTPKGIERWAKANGFTKRTKVYPDQAALMRAVPTLAGRVTEQLFGGPEA